MASYYYLISSLPTLKANGDNLISYTDFLKSCKGNVSESKYKELEELSIQDQSNIFLRKWNEFYKTFQEELTFQRKTKLGQPTNVPNFRDAKIKNAVTSAVSCANPLEAEQILLNLQFEYLDDLVTLHSFDDYCLFGYAIKLKLLERKRSFNFENGKIEFIDILDNIKKQIMNI